jgi:hypothetical protein
VVSLCRLKQCFSLHKDTTPPQPNHTITPTHIEPEQYNPRNKSTISHKLLKMDVLTSKTCWAVNSEIIKQVASSWSILIHLETIKLNRSRRFGHVQRMVENGIPKRVLYMNLRTKRLRGRPRNRWARWGERGWKNSWWRSVAGKST